MSAELTTYEGVVGIECDVKVGRKRFIYIGHGFWRRWGRVFDADDLLDRGPVMPA